MSDPFLIQGPALISFSGGRTSAHMLWRILQAHGGVLPADVRVAFANTGKEREETLRFVHECGSRWGVNIAWLEWRDGAPGFEEVGFNSASRAGEPFAALIAKKQRVPNWQERWCTAFLKVLPMHALMRALGLGEPGAYVEAIGLRADEEMRAFRGWERAEKDGRRVLYPLLRAKVRQADVQAFWREQSFDLQLARGLGNCTHCFAMGREERKARLAAHPGDAGWWIDIEERVGRFDRRDTVAKLLAEERRQPSMFDLAAEDDRDTECGDGCGFESAA